VAEKAAWEEVKVGIVVVVVVVGSSSGNRRRRKKKGHPSFP